jgi:hypothetical protein
MKTILFLSLITLSAFAYPHPKPAQFDYSLVFGGCFENDTVQLHINKVAVLKNYTLHNQDTAVRGRLSLTQSDKQITIFYNDQVKKRRGIRSTSTLTIELIVNQEPHRFEVDLRKGRVLLFDFCQADATTHKRLTLEQMQEPMILM